MRNIFYTLILCISINSAFAQVINNGGFESWNNEVVFQNPTFWSSSNLEFDFGDPNVTLASDAASGNSSVFLGTVDWNGDIAFGFVMAGVFGDDQPESGFPYEGTVEGLSCKLKYDVQPGDSATVLMVCFNQGDIVSMDVAKLAGTANDWTDFDLDLSNPVDVDEVLVAFASSNAMEEFGIEDSWLMVDDVKLISGGQAVSAVPNGDFEVWEDFEQNVAEGWDSNDFVTWDMVEQSDDAFLGNHSVRLENIYDSEQDETFHAYLTNGVFTNDGPEGGQEISEAPETVYGHFKYFPNGVDTGFVYFEFWNNDVLIGFAGLELDESTEWTGFEKQVEYFGAGTPDMVTITALAGNNESSVLFLDELSFTFVSSIPELVRVESSDVEVYPNPFEEILNIRNEFDGNLQNMQLYSPDGKLVWEMNVNSIDERRENWSIGLSHLEKGMYKLVIITNDAYLTKSVIKY